MKARERLPNRRRCETLEFQHAGHVFSLGVGFYCDGRVAELFISASHVGSPLEAIARDAAIIASLCLQHEADIETIRSALTRDHDGTAATLLGSALDALAVRS